MATAIKAAASLLLALLAGVMGPVALANPAMQGDWMLQLQSPGAPTSGLLQLELQNGEWRAWVEGGPAPVTVHGDELTIDIDTRDIRGFVYLMRLTGRFNDDRLSGEFIIDSKAKVNASPGTWTAGRYVEAVRPAEPSPVDLSGIWSPAPGHDIRKYSMDLTPAAAAWLDGYLMHYDQPNVRCVSPGITAMVAWGAYPFEILRSDARLTFIYEFDSEVRRIFLDGRDAPDFYPDSGMGFSTGRWEGSALVIKTDHLSPNTRDFRGEPVSENAVLKEVYALSEDGNTLSAVITLHDPDNYHRSPVRRRAWTRSPDTAIFPNECDPDSFFRQMYNEDLLDMYFERSRRRF